MDSDQNHMLRDTLHGGQLSQLLLNNKRATHQIDGEEVTHAIMTGGKFFIPLSMFREYLSALCGDFRCSTSMCVSELHSLVFPFYLDVDLTCGLQYLPTEFSVKLVTIANAQIRKFFDEECPDILECIICDKSHGAEMQHSSDHPCGVAWHEVCRQGEHDVLIADEELAALLDERQCLTNAELLRTGVYVRPAHLVITSSGRLMKPSVVWKHGFHIHWPRFNVDVDRALYVRESILAGVTRCDWEHEYGLKVGDWSDVIDRSVYNSGLRLVGSPKSSKCKSCKAKDPSCTACRRMNNRHIINPSHYRFSVAVRDQTIDPELTAHLKGNLLFVFQKTTVRCWNDHPKMTEGWRIYPMCPGVRHDKRGGKRKQSAAHGKTQGTSTAIVNVLRSHLTRHAAQYTETSLGVTRRNDTYFVKLSGDGSHYCLNKQGCHNSSTAWMCVGPMKKKARSAFNDGHIKYMSQMKCWCSKSRIGVSGKTCKDFEEEPIVLTSAETNVLYSLPSSSPASSGTSIRFPSIPFN